MRAIDRPSADPALAPGFGKFLKKISLLELVKGPNSAPKTRPFDGVNN